MLTRLALLSLSLAVPLTLLSDTTLLAQMPVSPAWKQTMRESAASSGLSKPDPASQAKIAETYGKLPLSFEANQGQTDGRVKFLTRTSGYALFLTGDETVFSWGAKTPKPTSLRMQLRNTSPKASVSGVDQLVSSSNYFVGNDPAKWRTNVPTYAKVRYERIYPGIDLVYYGNQRQLEYDFIVSPGADPRRIEFDVQGARRIRLDEKGDLVLAMSQGEIRWHRPVAYQEKNGTRQEVAAQYAITDKNRVGFELAKYDAARALYIDPLIYSTYLGGSGDDEGYDIAVDGAGNAYVTGQTASTDFPTKDPFQPTNRGTTTAFVTKINAAGSASIFSTYLGGTGGNEGIGIAVDSAGNVYLSGDTFSTDFPTVNPLQSTYRGNGDVYVSKLNATGSALIYSTYLGGKGSDQAGRIAVDGNGNAYVTGSTDSTNFPTVNPLQSANAGGSDAFVAKINPAGSALVYSTYLGGSAVDASSGIAVDSAGNAYVIGSTDSTNFPTVNPLQPANAGKYDAFVAKINPAGSALVYSTYYGGPENDYGSGIAVDAAGNAYIIGTSYTNFCNFNTCLYEDFVTKINPAGSAFVYRSTSNLAYTSGSQIVVDSSGAPYVVGAEGGDSIYPTYRTYVEKFDTSGVVMGSPTYLRGHQGSSGYGIATDGLGNAYITGETGSTDFPTKNPMQPANAGGIDAFVSKIDMRIVTTTTLTSSSNPSTHGQAVTFTSMVGSSSSGAPPDGETVSFMKGKTALGTGTLSGGTATFTTTSLPTGTNLIQAVYGGDTTFVGSKSKVVKQVVN